MQAAQGAVEAFSSRRAGGVIALRFEEVGQQSPHGGVLGRLRIARADAGELLKRVRRIRGLALIEHPLHRRHHVLQQRRFVRSQR